jgi:hypothetical protein
MLLFDLIDNELITIVTTGTECLEHHGHEQRTHCFIEQELPAVDVRALFDSVFRDLHITRHRSDRRAGVMLG